MVSSSPPTSVQASPDQNRLIPEQNAKDLVEISESIKKGLEIVPVSRMDEVLARAMTRKPEPIEWDETAAAAVPEEAPVEEEGSTLTAH